MSDYISKSALLDIVGGMPLNWEYGKAVSDIYGIIKEEPTLDETEIIRKAFERVLERLEEEKRIAFLTLANTGNTMKDIVYNEVMAYLNTAIEIVKEECGINE